MSLKIQNMKENDWVLLHDFYHEAPEPDAPKLKFEDLSPAEKLLATSQYSVDSFKSVLDEDSLIGFVGFFPYDNSNVNLFCVIAPSYRGKGYFPKILDLSLEYCCKEFVGFKYLRGLARKENTPSIRGMERASFIRKGSVIEEVQPEVEYEEYLLPI